MMFQEQANPIGVAFEDPGVANFVSYMKTKWDEETGRFPWWQFWKRVSLVKVTNFLVNALEDIISYVDQFMDKSGADKKATVLEAISQLYDYVVSNALPVWLRPLSKALKQYIIYEVISAAIDWMVSKYHSGEWQKKDPQQLVKMWS